MRRLLVAVLALGLLLVPGASANHDPFHSACKQKIAAIESAFHSSGTKQQRLNRIHTEIHRGTLCESEPVVPPPPGPPPPPPPPVAQGENLPALHAWNVGANYYVDSASGSDSTGDGSEGNPWQTLQGTYGKLTDGTVTWPTDQDLVVNCKGTFKASSAASRTLDIFFSNSARAPNANRFVIWRNWPGNTCLIQNPDGSSGQKGAIATGTNALNSHQIFYGLEVDGEDTRKGGAGNGNSYGFYLQGNTANSNTLIEILNCEIHGFQAASGSPSSAQGITMENGTSHLKIVGNRIYDIGTATGTTDIQEHALYLHQNNQLVMNNLIYNISNGYNVQFYNSDNNTFDDSIVAHNTLVDSECSGIVIHGNASDIAFKNNIIARHTGRGAGSYGIEFHPAGNGSATGSVVDFNVYFDNEGGNLETTPTGWTHTNAVGDDPLFTNEGTRDYTLQEGSPAIGHSDTTYSPSTDIDGNPRPAGSEDAGAFQFTEPGAARNWVWR